MVGSIREDVTKLFTYETLVLVLLRFHGLLHAAVFVTLYFFIHHYYCYHYYYLNIIIIIILITFALRSSCKNQHQRKYELPLKLGHPSLSEKTNGHRKDKG